MITRSKLFLTILTVLFMTVMFAGPAFAQSLTLDVDPADTAVEGDLVTLTANVDGVPDGVDLEYRFAYRKSGTTKIYLQPVQTDPVWSITVPAGAAGEWDLGVQVRQAGKTNWSSSHALTDVVFNYVITEEPVDPGPDPEPELTEVGTSAAFMGALNDEVEGIILTDDIVLEERVRVRHDLQILDLDGYAIVMVELVGDELVPIGGPLAFEGNGTLVRNGAIFGNTTWWSWEGPGVDGTDEWPYGANLTDRPWATWQSPFSGNVMISGTGVTFDNVGFHVNVADWYQTQADKTASGLTIKDSAFHGVSLFNSDVVLEGNIIANRVGIENDNAWIEGNTFVDGSIPANTVVIGYTAAGSPIYHPAVDGLFGSIYVNSDATLVDNVWADNFTGMFVGKSLKYYGKYSDAKPTLDGAVIITDKYGLVWWAINHEKAELHTTGVVDVTSNQGGPGLILVGTDARNYYPNGGPGDYKWDGGAILGNARFVGADVWFGKPTVEFYMDHKSNYEGKVGYYIEGVWVEFDDLDWTEVRSKWPLCLEYVDYQVCKKDADRLFIHGPDFRGVDVTIFTPANDYIGSATLDGQNVDVNANFPWAQDWNYGVWFGVNLLDPVWLGNVQFGDIELWGDFNIIRNGTVTFEEIKLMCGNIRRIGSDREPDPVDYCTGERHPWNHRGTLTGGVILSDTKEANVLVIGSGVLVRNVDFHNYLYNVILESAYLQNVDISVGMNPQTTGPRYIGYYNDYGFSGYIDLNSHPLYAGNPDYDVFVWSGYHATFDNVGLFGTDVLVMDAATLTIIDPLNWVNSVIKIAKTGFVIYDEVVEGSLDIRHVGGRAYIDFEVEALAPFLINDWKYDIWIEADDPYSKVYELRVPDPAPGNDWFYIYLDLQDPDMPAWAYCDGDGLQGGFTYYDTEFSLVDGVWFSTLLIEPLNDIFGNITTKEQVRELFMQTGPLGEFAANWRLSLVYSYLGHHTADFDLYLTASIFNCCGLEIEVAEVEKEIELERKAPFCTDLFDGTTGAPDFD